MGSTNAASDPKKAKLAAALKRNITRRKHATSQNKSTENKPVPAAPLQRQEA